MYLSVCLWPVAGSIGHKVVEHPEWGANPSRRKLEYALESHATQSERANCTHMDQRMYSNPGGVRQREIQNGICCLQKAARLQIFSLSWHDWDKFRSSLKS